MILGHPNCTVITAFFIPLLDIAMRVDLGYAPRIFVVLYALMAVAVGLSVPIGLTLLVVLYYCFKHGKFGLVLMPIEMFCCCFCLSI